MNTSSASAPIVAVFSSAIELRVIMLNDQPWFVAGDVAAALDYDKTSNMLRILDDDEKGAHNLSTLGGTQSLSIISESGLYAAVLKSRKPEAKKFRKWVTSEVLPQIRKTGTYTLPAAPCIHEYLDSDDMKRLTRLVWSIAGMIGKHASQAMWHALRLAADCKAPNRFEVKHIPDLVTELRRLYSVVVQYRHTVMSAEKEILTSCIRGRETDDAVLSDMQCRIMAESKSPEHSYTLIVSDGGLGNMFDRDLMAFVQRCGYVSKTGYPGYEESISAAQTRRINSRRDLSFVRVGADGGLINWVVEHDKEGNYRQCMAKGLEMFDEVVDLSAASEVDAFNALFYAAAWTPEFRREGWGIETGFVQGMAMAAIDGIRARRAGLAPFSPDNEKKRGRKAAPKGKALAKPAETLAIAA